MTNETVFLVRQHIAMLETDAWYYVAVTPAKASAFLEAVRKKDGSRKLTDYGTILKSGYGEPAPELRAEMEARYGLAKVPAE